MRYFHTLTFRVLVGSCLLLIALFGLYTNFAVSFHNQQMMDQVRDNANSLSDIIKNATHYSMLKDRPQDVKETIYSIGREGVEIRIYNKRGQIMVSTDRALEGSYVEQSAEACNVCHDSTKPLAQPLQSVPAGLNFRGPYIGPKGNHLVGLINPIRNEQACYGCHTPDQTVLGVLDVRLSLDKVADNIAEARRKLILYAITGTVVVMLSSGIFLSVTVHRPVRRLREGTNQISAGHLDFRIPLSSRDEIGELARAFNEMTQSLQKAEQENKLWSQTLEKRVEEKTAELKHIHEQILQIEKMASLGKLSATVAHELNNPLEGILNYSKLISKRLRKIESTPATQSTLEDLELITSEVQRCGNIVKNLLLFSKRQVGEFGLVPVADLVDKAVRLMQHHFKISNVNFQAEIATPEATLMCDENQIQQALIALFVNAVEAMPQGGDLKLTAMRDASGGIRMDIADTGAGIAAEDLPHLFEPFFTTKKEGKGVGLGLSVVYGILERHDGTVSVRSEPGKGTTFTLTFPPAEKHHPRVEAKGAVT
ncbi:MAG: HAMP domain-containing histidine kinase [Acidobacteriia bacterium]|nr:HAMP domain-containing histidine kinase [Terriglobia bacterium]